MKTNQNEVSQPLETPIYLCKQVDGVMITYVDNDEAVGDYADFTIYAQIKSNVELGRISTSFNSNLERENFVNTLLESGLSKIEVESILNASNKTNNQQPKEVENEA